MPIDKSNDQCPPRNVIRNIRCRDCGYERQITDQWLREVSPKLSKKNRIIEEAEIPKYFDRLSCSKCKGKNAIITTTSMLIDRPKHVNYTTTVSSPSRNWMLQPDRPKAKRSEKEISSKIFTKPSHVKIAENHQPVVMGEVIKKMERVRISRFISRRKMISNALAVDSD